MSTIQSGVDSGAVTSDEQRQYLQALAAKRYSASSAPARAQAASPSTYDQIAGKIQEMVGTGELSRADQLQLHTALSRKGYGPGMPNPLAANPNLTPPGLRTSQPSQPMANPFGDSLVDGLATYGKKVQGNGLDDLVNAIPRMSQPGIDSKALGLHMALSGLGRTIAPAALPVALATPLALAVALAGGWAGSKAAGALGRSMDVGPGVQALLEDGGGAVGGLLGSGAVSSGVTRGLLRSGAEKTLTKMLNPGGTANKTLATEVIPQLLDRGDLAWTRPGLQGQLNDRAAASGQAVQALHDLHAGGQVPIGPILADMQAGSDKAFLTPGGTSLSSSADGGSALVAGLRKRTLDESGYRPGTHHVRFRRAPWVPMANRL